MFEIVFFGTSASAPSIQRGLPSLAVLAADHRFLVDCGEGTQRQILRSGIGFKRLNRILLTHAHLDHILGLGGLISTFARWEDIETIEIYGSRHTLDRVHALLYEVVLRYDRVPVEVRMLELQPGLFFEAKDFTLSAVPVTHRGSGSYGFVFEEKARRPFLVEKAEALGVPSGPERGQLVAGRSITLADGRLITPDMVLGPEMRGTKVVCIGDTGRTDNLREAAQNADALVIEATFLESEAEEAARFGHITARKAAILAAEMGVGTLILTHISRRYRASAIAEEAQQIFPNTYVARDLDHFQVRRGQPVQKLTPEETRGRNLTPDPEPEPESE